jgi:hypothetical protein
LIHVPISPFLFSFNYLWSDGVSLDGRHSDCLLSSVSRQTQYSEIPHAEDEQEYFEELERLKEE